MACGVFEGWQAGRGYCIYASWFSKWKGGRRIGAILGWFEEERSMNTWIASDGNP
jgi:hypothetical protein